MTTVAIFGVSGRTGSALCAAASTRGWAVRGLCRISGIAPTDAAVIHGGFQDSARVRQVVQGTDAVCCVIGPRPPYVDVFCAAATRAIMDAMVAAGCRRLLCVTGAMIGDVPTLSRPMSWLRAWFRWRRPAVARDREDQESAVAASPLDWTIIKPPRLTDAGPCGRTVAGPALPVGLRSSVCRADLASFLLDEVAGPRFVRQRVIVQRGS